jgi:hypothetical protein
MSTNSLTVPFHTVGDALLQGEKVSKDAVKNPHCQTPCCRGSKLGMTVKLLEQSIHIVHQIGYKRDRCRQADRAYGFSLRVVITCKSVDNLAGDCNFQSVPLPGDEGLTPSPHAFSQSAGVFRRFNLEVF